MNLWNIAALLENNLSVYTLFGISSNEIFHETLKIFQIEPLLVLDQSTGWEILKLLISLKSFLVLDFEQFIDMTWYRHIAHFKCWPCCQAARK